MALDDDTLKKFKKLLIDMKRELIENAKKTIDSSIASQVSSGKDFADLALKEMDRNFVLRIRDRERKLISKIDQALERIENKSFGICEECGQEIGIKRLEARPVTTLCIECKTKQEEEEVD